MSLKIHFIHLILRVTPLKGKLPSINSAVFLVAAKGGSKPKEKMLENRPIDAIDTLVKLVRGVVKKRSFYGQADR